MIEIDSISFKYRTGKIDTRWALRGLSINFKCDGITVIVGTSGIGKSTLIALLAGVHLQNDPQVEYYNGSITIRNYSPTQLRGTNNISWVPQRTAFLDHLTAKDNITLPAEMSGLKNIEDRYSSLTCALNIGDWQKKRPRELSGGMRTRISLARALICEPQYLFLDEPFVGLDLSHRWHVCKLIAEERRVNNLTTLITTHNIPEAILLADRVVAISEVGEQTVAAVYENARMKFEDRCASDHIALARKRASRIEGEIFAI